MASEAPYIVGICGPSGAGKTYLLQRLAQRFKPDQLSIISQDNYYREDSELEPDNEGLINYDHPQAVDLARLTSDILALKEGKSVEISKYSYTPTDHIQPTLSFRPAPLLLVEGIFTLYYPPLYELLSLKIFIEAPEQVRLDRRIRRDQEERGYSLPHILKNYEKYVVPMYKEFIEPCKGKSDLIIPNHQDISKAIDVIATHLESAL